MADVQAIAGMVGKVVKSERKHCAELPTACARTLATRSLKQEQEAEGERCRIS